MRSVLSDWLAVSRCTWRRDLTLIVLVALASTVAACGGTTTAPHCTNKCYAVAGFYQNGVDFASPPQGVDVAMTIANLTCNSTCTNAGGGYVANYVLLGDSHLDKWVRMGYSSLTQYQTLANGSTWDYYAEVSVPGLMEWIPFNQGNVADVGQDVNFTIHDVTLGGQDEFYVSYSAPSGYDGIILAPGSTGYSSTFHPGATEAGEVLHGSQGESADSAFYTGFYYSATDLAASPSGAESPSAFPLFLNGIGHVENDQPPFGAWVGFEGVSNAWFQTYCCTTI